MNNNLMKNRLLVLVGFFLVWTFGFSFVFGLEGSVSQTTVQYSSPGTSFGEFSSLFGGPTISDSSSQTSEFYDMQVFIPPLGCQPYIVRSDLLEEQNVPVFCKLVPLKINPGIGIDGIERISVVQKESNDYISSVGFHPANAAITSGGNFVNNPTTDNIGYVVVVLKQIEDEKFMPDTVNVTLAASFEYKASNAYGIGEHQFYLPVLSQEEFENKYLDYSFFDGRGYLRVEDMDETSAVISIYTYDGKTSSGFRQVFRDRIELGKTSRDFYLSTSTGGQGLRVTLKDITLAETKARIKVNGQIFEVYQGSKFYNGKCELLSLNSLAAGAGNAKIRCGSKIFELEKKLNKVEFLVEGEVEQVGLGERLGVSENSENYYYLVYANALNSGDAVKEYAFIARIEKAKVDSMSSGELKKALDALIKEVETKAKGKTNIADLKQINLVDNTRLGSGSNKVSLIFLSSDEKENTGLAISFKSLTISDKPLKDSEGYFQKALEAYDKVKADFGSQGKDSKYSYGETALWAEYDLALALGQNEKLKEILSRIENEYPDSLHSSGLSATRLIQQKNILSSEGASDYDSSQDILIELLGVIEPSEEDAGVNLHYSIDSAGAEYKTGLNKGDIIYSNLDLSKVITLVSFTDKEAFVEYSCKLDDGTIRENTIKVSKEIAIPECRARLTIDKISQKKIAEIKIIPIVRGRAKESNFTFAIGIEKRALSMDLTPEEANKKMESLNKQIARWRNITDTLNRIIEIDKVACFATSAYVNLKNLIKGMNGEATARQEVMARWNKICKGDEDCIRDNSDDIETDVDAVKAIQEGINTEIEKFEKKYNELNPEEQAKTTAFAGRVKIFRDSHKVINLGRIAGENAGGVIDQDTVIEGKTISEIISGINVDGANRDISSSELSTLEQNLGIIEKQASVSKQTVDSARQEVYDSLKLIRGRQRERENYEALVKASGGLPVYYSIEPNAERKPYKPMFWDAATRREYNLDENENIAEKTPFALVNSKGTSGKLFFAVLKMDTGGEYVIDPNQVYEYTPKTDSTKGSVGNKVESNSLNEVPLNMVFNPTTTKGYHNKCTNCNEVKVFSLEPYKGMPALLPFDIENGWYIQVKQLFPGLGTGEQKSVLDSGKLNSFWICNVGTDGLLEGNELDRDCARFDFYTGSLDENNRALLGLEPREARQIIQDGISAYESAQKQLTSNPETITIRPRNGKSFSLRVRASEGDLGSKCTDFMSASDCSLIFNVCDPVVCPNSRCDLGGRFKVDNVIQSGIVGSTLLCLPNFKGFGGDVYFPFCLTGISAGIDGWISILEGYRDCINDSVNNKSLTGICDEVHSVYLCDLFWRQVGPFSEAMLKNVFLLALGRGEHGGGEYLFVEDAWNNAEKSAQYFQTSYAKDSKISFGFKEITNTIVTEVCKSPMSATYPNGFDAMLEPESPVQFHAFYEEIPYTSATVPATSMYKVYYHIYAGKESGHQFQVYLKSPTETPGYITKDSVVVASGYVNKDATKDETIEKLDVSGFKELCVRIDGADKCGFKSVSTSAVLNYAKDATTRDMATNPVTSEAECVAGGVSAGSLITPNIQQGVEEVINPEIYNQGITRVCSSVNPGENTERDRWRDVGYCGNKAMRCWLDTRSLERAIQGLGIENKSLYEVEQMDLKNKINTQGYYDKPKGAEEIRKLKDKYAGIIEATGELTEAQITLIGELNAEVAALDKKLIYFSQRAELALFKAEVLGSVAIASESSKVAVKEAVAEDVDASGSEAVEEAVSEEVIIIIDNNNIVFKRGNQEVKTELILEGEIIKYEGENVASIYSSTTDSSTIKVIDRSRLYNLNIPLEQIRYLDALDKASIDADRKKITSFTIGQEVLNSFFSS